MVKCTKKFKKKILSYNLLNLSKILSKSLKLNIVKLIIFIFCSYLYFYDNMYLNQHQLDQILKTPFFSQLHTHNVIKYVLYRGKFNVVVHTVRFNFTSQFSENTMFQYLYSYLLSVFPINTHVLGTIEYDLLLEDSTSNPKSYYIWRANSNASHINNAIVEIFFPLSYNNLYRFAENALNVRIPELNVYFKNSHVKINRLVAIVFTFTML